MTTELAPFIDARRFESSERRCALVTFEGSAVMFTASWGAPVALVRRPDGGYRREYVVHLCVPEVHRDRTFHKVQSVMLCLTGLPELTLSTDVVRESSPKLDEVTLAVYIDELH
jgi:hypothetical protein